ncbi:hypothetical protein Mpt1_c03700 [Candidatus Methanoplasma termitum]|uniref:Uncharacterized protein n=1 Tax=Candidatus Methanoplasma termitum TaxID=1577791 RepID=A0A0A7LAS1_9ARCH|nr:hypothetical protein [Candidatus Methanoplasma termitum]AIZ56265.1 hypothetical protein Mpt1_c03700 [Candidatus Methanoplasma termitum]MCL2333720.1 hypothetical protein [Candidatus Methanoplasma sp.]
MVARDRPYSELKNSLIGKKVVIWTCNTCARLCYDVGGKESAERLASALKSDGIDVLGVLDTSASCLEGKVRSKYDEEMFGRADIVVSLTCNIGALCARRVFGKEILNPLATVGAGFADSERTVFVCEDSNGVLSVKELRKIAEEKGLWCDPYA